MSTFDRKTILRLAQLARLKLDDTQASALADQLSRILAYFEQLAELDTTNVEPTAHPLPLCNVFREDQPHPSWTSDQTAANAPQFQSGFFRVPKVLDQDDE